MGCERTTRALIFVVASLLVLPPAAWSADGWPDPVPIVRGIPAPPTAEVIALCPDISEYPQVFTARDGDGLAGRLASGSRYRVVLVDPWASTAARLAGFDGVAREVYPGMIDQLAAQGGRVTWIGHGLCGLLPMAAAARASVRTVAARWVALGTRFDYRDPSPLLRSWLDSWRGGERPLPQLLAALLFSGLRTSLGNRPSSLPVHLGDDGGVPADVLEAFHRERLSREPSAAVLEDLARWFESDRMMDTEGWTDYGRGFDAVTGPALLVAGASDAIAPPEDVLPAMDRFSAEVGARFHLLSRSDGDREEYGHLGMLLSRNSARDVDGMIAAWLQGRYDLP